MESKRKDSTMCSNLLFCLQYFVDHPRAVSPLVETAKHLSEDVISLQFTRTGIPIVKAFLKINCEFSSLVDFKPGRLPGNFDCFVLLIDVPNCEHSEKRRSEIVTFCTMVVSFFVN